jgi:hypothetical protein
MKKPLSSSVFSPMSNLCQSPQVTHFDWVLRAWVMRCHGFTREADASRVLLLVPELRLGVSHPHFHDEEEQQTAEADVEGVPEDPGALDGAEKLLIGKERQYISAEEQVGHTEGKRGLPPIRPQKITISFAEKATAIPGLPGSKSLHLLVADQGVSQSCGGSAAREDGSKEFVDHLGFLSISSDCTASVFEERFVNVSRENS